jgi:hypothetical protein
MISLGGGLPSSSYFPFQYIDVKIPSIGKFSEAETLESGKVMHIGKHDVKEGKSAFDLSISLNYGQGTGSAQILRWITEHTEVGRWVQGVFREEMLINHLSRLFTTLLIKTGSASQALEVHLH